MRRHTRRTRFPSDSRCNYGRRQCNIPVEARRHFDDAVETFFLSLFYEGRLSCFQPVTYLDRMGITQIRPLLVSRLIVDVIMAGGNVIFLWKPVGTQGVPGGKHTPDIPPSGGQEKKRANHTHYTVVTGYGGQFLYLADSIAALANAEGGWYNRRLRAEEFEDLWSTDRYPMEFVYLAVTP